MARIGRGQSREEIAKLLDVSPRTIANWETGGVPSHRVNLVTSRLGMDIRAAQSEIEYMDHLATPSGRKQHDEWLEQQAKFYDSDETVAPVLTIREALRPYTTESLLNEVRLRTSDLESKIAELHDPDYSNMSEQDAKDYGLAAKEADVNIGHDELPHEP